MEVELEHWISRAEIAYKSGRIKSAIKFAKRALEQCTEPSLRTSLRIFIARAHSKQGNYSESNTIYRQLITEKTYLPPIIMGLLYNNLKTNNNSATAQKISRNLGLIKIFVR